MKFTGIDPVGFMNKSRAIGTAIVILLLAGAAFWLARSQKTIPTPPVGQNQNSTSTPTSTPMGVSGKPLILSSNLDTSSWKIYRNEEYGFEFRYPSDWRLATSTPVQMLFVSGNQYKELLAKANGDKDNPYLFSSYLSDLAVEVDRDYNTNQLSVNAGIPKDQRFSSFAELYGEIIRRQPEQELVSEDPEIPKRLCGSRLITVKSFQNVLRTIDCADYFDVYDYSFPHRDVSVRFEFPDQDNLLEVGNAIVRTFWPLQTIIPDCFAHGGPTCYEQYGELLRVRGTEFAINLNEVGPMLYHLDTPKPQRMTKVMMDPGVGGYELPTLYGTGADNIVVFSNSIADGGGFVARHVFVSTSTWGFVAVQEGNGDYIRFEVPGQSFHVKFSVSARCYDEKTSRYREGERVRLYGLTVNGKETLQLKPQKTLYCYDPGGIGSEYNPALQFKFVGIDPSFRKVYFQLSAHDQTKNPDRPVWSEDYELDLGLGSVSQTILPPDELLLKRREVYRN